MGNLLLLCACLLVSGGLGSCRHSAAPPPEAPGAAGTAARPDGSPGHARHKHHRPQPKARRAAALRRILPRTPRSAY
ncbi:MAG: hypothetical protein Q4F30_00910 [Akkermansia sp.]|nr:hypothetical protein [Akkermansia sp.]